MPQRVLSSALAGGFAEAAGCSLYGKPNLEAALSRLKARPVFLVPTLMAAGTTFAALRERVAALADAATVRLCPPLGEHPALAERIATAAGEVTAKEGWLHAETALLLIGHGSRINKASRRAMQRLRRAVETSGVFIEVKTAFLSEEPGIETALATLESQQVVAVGCFAAAGRHAAKDVPALLATSDKPMIYTGAIGEASWIDTLLLEQAQRGVAATTSTA